MKLMEFKSIWINDYTREERKEYTAIHGDNELNWPEKVDYSPIYLDIERIVRINSTRKFRNGLTIEIAGGGIHCVQMPIKELINILDSYGLFVKITIHEPENKADNEPTT